MNFLNIFDQNYFRDCHENTGQLGVLEDVLIFPGHPSENRDSPGKSLNCLGLLGIKFLLISVSDGCSSVNRVIMLQY